MTLLSKLRQLRHLPALAGPRMLLPRDGHCLHDQALALRGLPRDQDEFQAPSLHNPGANGDQSAQSWRKLWPAALGATLLPGMAVDSGVAAGKDIDPRPSRGSSVSLQVGLPKAAFAAGRRVPGALAPPIAPPL